MTRSEWYVGDTAIEVPGYRWVRSDHKMHGPSTATMAQVTLPGMDGELALPTTHTVGASEFTLSVAFYGDSYEDMFNRKTAFERMITPKARLVQITERMPSGQSLTARCYLIGSAVAELWDGDQDYLEADYSFRIPSGVWLGPSVQFTLPGSGTHRVPQSLLNGSAPMYETTIDITGADVDFNIAAGDDGAAFVAFNGPTNGGVRIKPAMAVASYPQAAGASVDAAKYLSTGRRTFYIPADGYVHIDRAIGVGSITIQARKAYY